jgi:uncharacterized RDD family membrane protein YckC
MSRGATAILLIIVGIALAALSFLFLTAPLGIPTSEEFSNPRLQFSPLLFIIGVMLIFIAPVVYELKSEKE